MTEPAATYSTRSRLLAVAVVVGLFVIPASAAILFHFNKGPQHHDQVEYHLTTILKFAAEWPSFDFKSYPAAMTPGYHLLMTLCYRLGAGVETLQFFSLAITVGLVATMAWAVSRTVPAIDAVLLALPMVFSQYVFMGGVYIAPHNIAWWGVLGVLLIALRPRVDRWTYILGGIALWAMVMARQIHLWALGALLISVWIKGQDELSPSLRTRMNRVGLMLLSAIPTFICLGYFFYQWGGLAPTEQAWVKPSNGVNFAAIVAILAAFGMFGLFFLGWATPRGGATAVVKSSLVGLGLATLLAILTPSSYSRPEGRWSGLWNVAAQLPTVADRSLLMVELAMAGGLVLGAMFSLLKGRDRWIFAFAIAGFIAAHATINQAWQRYHEPFVLLVLPLAAARVSSTSDPLLRRGLLVGATILQMGLTLFSLRG